MTLHMPPITLSDEDVDRLEGLADSPELRGDAAAARLLGEIARARVVPAHALPGDVVTMNSSVECVEEHTGHARCLTLVYPRDADIAQGRVSVLSPVGMALLGLRVGQSIDWPAPAGNPLRLTVTARAARDREHAEALLDDALRATFPASDPVAVFVPAHKPG